MQHSGLMKDVHFPKEQVSLDPMAELRLLPFSTLLKLCILSLPTIKAFHDGYMEKLAEVCGQAVHRSSVMAMRAHT